MERRATLTRWAVALSGGMTVASLGLGLGPAKAAPTNAPSVVTGTAICGASLELVAFTANGNGHWSSAHLTFPDGSIGIFHPNAFYTSGLELLAAKNNPAPDTVRCLIQTSSVPLPFGAVSGTITSTG